MTEAFDKKVRHRTFKKGDLAFAVRRPMIHTHKSKGKFKQKWKGPYVVNQVYSSGAYTLLNMGGDRFMMPINGKNLKKYYS